MSMFMTVAPVVSISASRFRAMSSGVMVSPTVMPVVSISASRITCPPPDTSTSPVS